MSKKLSQMDLPTLPGWITLADAAELFGWSRQYTHRKAAGGYFSTLTRVGNTYIINTWEANDLVEDYKTH